MAASLLDQQIRNFSRIPFLNEIHYQLWIDHYHPRDFAKASAVSFVLQVIPEYGKDESSEA